MTVTLDSVGRYECRAATTGFPEISRQLMVFARGRPEVTARSPQRGATGGTVHIECVVSSVPPPSATVWYQYGRAIRTGEAIQCTLHRIWVHTVCSSGTVVCSYTMHSSTSKVQSLRFRASCRDSRSTPQEIDFCEIIKLIHGRISAECEPQSFDDCGALQRKHSSDQMTPYQRQTCTLFGTLHRCRLICNLSPKCAYTVHTTAPY